MIEPVWKEQTSIILLHVLYMTESCMKLLDDLDIFRRKGTENRYGDIIIIGNIIKWVYSLLNRPLDEGRRRFATLARE